MVVRLLQWAFICAYKHSEQQKERRSPNRSGSHSVRVEGGKKQRDAICSATADWAPPCSREERTEQLHWHRDDGGMTEEKEAEEK